jgi:hypothetical protein
MTLPLPKDQAGLKRDRNAIFERYYPGRVILRRTIGRHTGAVGVTVFRAYELLIDFHLVPDRAIFSVREKLHAHIVWRQTVKVDLDNDQMFPAFGGCPDLAEAKVVPFESEGFVPFFYPDARLSLFSSARVYSDTTRLAENRGVKSAILSRIRATHPVEIPFSSRV